MKKFVLYIIDRVLNVGIQTTVNKTLLAIIIGRSEIGR